MPIRVESDNVISHNATSDHNATSPFVSIHDYAHSHCSSRTGLFRLSAHINNTMSEAIDSQKGTALGGLAVGGPSQVVSTPAGENAPAHGAIQKDPQPGDLPPFTLRNVLLDVYHGGMFLVHDPKARRLVVPLIVCAVSIVCKVIIANVAYTEIDFSTYMQQVDMVSAGELDYSVIGGDSGPIVYPAGFVQVYQMLSWLTEGGQYIRRAQFAFGYLFTATTALTCTVYCMAADVPPWPLYLLLCSKRLYSIYVLRLFNDCFATVGVLAVVLLLQLATYWRRHMSGSMTLLLCAVAADVYSMALSVKMNVLLYLPAFGLVVFFLVGERLVHTALVLLVIPVVQLMIGWRFLLPLFWDDDARYLRWAYLSNAFDFSRQFLYKWTVNWKFVGEDTFLSPAFANALLVGHVSVLAAFVFGRFLHPKVTGKLLLVLVKDTLARPFENTVSGHNLLLSRDAGPQLVLLIFSVTNLIGVLFARSLHYQFLSWYCWLMPFLLYACRCNVVVGCVVFVLHELCWNVYPSTAQSSQLLVVILSGILLSVYFSDIWFKRANLQHAQLPPMQ